MAVLTTKERVSALAFLALTLGLLAVGILALVGWKPGARPRFFSLRFADSVATIEEGVPVRYKGLKCGKVDSLGIDRADPSTILVSIRVESGIPITASTVARIGSNSILGPYFIDLDASVADEAPLAPGSEIPVMESTLSRILKTGETLGDQLPALLTQAQTWFEPERRDAFFAAIEEIRNLSSRATRAIDELEPDARDALIAWRQVADRTIQVIDANEGEFRRLVQEAARAAASLRSAIDDAKVGVLSERVESTLTRLQLEVESTSAAVRDYLARNDVRPELAALRAAAETLATSLASDVGTVSKASEDTLRRDVAPALQEMARAAAALERVAALIERAPRSFLFGAPEPEKTLPGIPK